MRAAVLCLLAVGCGKPAALPVELEPPAGKVDSVALLRHYRSERVPHSLEGKNVELRMQGDVMFAPDGNGTLCYVWRTNEGYRRPAIVARTKDKYAPPRSGKEKTFGSATLYGRLVGLVPAKGGPEFAEWAKLEPSERDLGDKMILLEDVVVLVD